MTIVGVYTFRVTRDAEMSIQELEADDLLETIEQGVLRRRFGSVVRLTIDTATPDDVRHILLDNLDLEPEGLVPVAPPLGMSGINLLGLDRPDLKDPPFVPAVPRGLDDPDLSVFAAIRKHDILIHRPYDSFEPVIDWLESAAHDPDVLAIKMTLYRVGRNAPAVAALLEAARNGKEVAVLVELKARFDEESNIEWARALEDEGVHVVYGLVGIKTHSKIGMVVRREGDGMRRYAHLGTGNYNVVTARLYTDLDLFTCDEVIGQDATELFNFLTGFSRTRDYKKLLVGPINLRDRFEALLEREIEHQLAGRGGHLVFKMNSLIDRKMIAILYRASQAGVKIDLLVRGMCSLRPGIPGVSDNIKVTSIVGRFLEHSRIYWFRNGGDEQVLVGSADLMPRNLNRRVEILFPVEDPAIVRRLRDEILAVYLRDNVKARFMQADGSYLHSRPADGEEALDSQAWFIAHAADRAPSRGGIPADSAANVDRSPALGGQSAAHLLPPRPGGLEDRVAGPRWRAPPDRRRPRRGRSGRRPAGPAGISVDAVLDQPSRAARQTAEIAAAVLGCADRSPMTSASATDSTASASPRSSPSTPTPGPHAGRRRTRLQRDHRPDHRRHVVVKKAGAARVDLDQQTMRGVLVWLLPPRVFAQER